MQHYTQQQHLTVCTTTENAWDMSVYPLSRCEDEDTRQWWESTWMEDLSTDVGVGGPDDTTVSYAWTDQALDLTTFVDLPCGSTQTTNPDTHTAGGHQYQAIGAANTTTAAEEPPELLPLVPVEVHQRPPLQPRVAPPPAKRRRIDRPQAATSGGRQQQPQHSPQQQPLLPAPIASDASPQYDFNFLPRILFDAATIPAWRLLSKKPPPEQAELPHPIAMYITYLNNNNQRIVSQRQVLHSNGDEFRFPSKLWEHLVDTRSITVHLEGKH